MQKMKLTLGLMLLLPANFAWADEVRTARPGDIAIISDDSQGGVCDGNLDTCVSASVGISRDAFASSEDLDKAIGAASVAAAMQDAIPIPGDRFAMRFGAAGNGDAFAGAIGLSLNVTDRARVSLNYGQGRETGMVAGGLNLSFK